MAAAVVADGAADVLGHGVDVLDQILDALALQLGVLVERRVEVVDVRRVVLVVMDPHRLFVDVGLQRVVIVGQWRK